MSAIAREIARALCSNPNAPPQNARIILSTYDFDKENQPLNESLKTILDESFLLTEVEPHGLVQFAKNKDNINSFDAAIFSNLLTGLKVVEDANKISEILSNLLIIMKAGAIVIIRENFEDYEAQLLADVTKFLDVFALPHRMNDDTTRIFGFDFYAMNQLQDSIYAKSNFLDVFWTLRMKSEPDKSSGDSSDEKLRTYREFLDRTQYTVDNVMSYEWIFGENFISPGGVNENRRILKYFQKLTPGHRMLDIGVGIGGGARQAAKEYGAHVLGCDLSSNMILHAFERNQRDKDHRVEYLITDATVYRYAENSFDAVFSRDCIHHIPHIDALFAKIFKCLKPGGELLTTMYGKGYGKLQKKFLDYVTQRQYYLNNIEEFAQAAKQVGFINIYTENMTPRFEEILRAERQKAIDYKDEFIQKFGEKLFYKHIEGWADKLQFIKDDNHNWLLLRAEKPAIK